MYMGTVAPGLSSLPLKHGDPLQRGRDTGATWGKRRAGHKKDRYRKGCSKPKETQVLPIPRAWGPVGAIDDAAHQLRVALSHGQKFSRRCRPAMYRLQARGGWGGGGEGAGWSPDGTARLDDWPQLCSAVPGDLNSCHPMCEDNHSLERLGGGGGESVLCVYRKSTWVGGGVC